MNSEYNYPYEPIGREFTFEMEGKDMKGCFVAKMIQPAHYAIVYRDASIPLEEIREQDVRSHMGDWRELVKSPLFWD